MPLAQNPEHLVSSCRITADFVGPSLNLRWMSGSSPGYPFGDWVLSIELLLVCSKAPIWALMSLSARCCAVRGDFEETCAASSNAKLHDALVGSANGDRHGKYHPRLSFSSRNAQPYLLYVPASLLPLLSIRIRKALSLPIRDIRGCRLTPAREKT
jgi:hypothetical protein